MNEAAEKIATLPGIWITRSNPRLAYRVLPKCGCSSIGQFFHFLDHGTLYGGDIHERSVPILRSDIQEQAAEFTRVYDGEDLFRFTFVRNPFKRLLSSFADKIVGYQTDGRRYRAGRLHRLLQENYDVKWNGDINLISNFKGFVRFVADTIDTRQPIESDIHWTPCVHHLQFTMTRDPEWYFDSVGYTESFVEDLDLLAKQAGISSARMPRNLPRENRSHLPMIPMSTFFGREEVEIMRRVYEDDFLVFGYAPDPEILTPIARVGVDRINDALRDRMR